MYKYPAIFCRKNKINPPKRGVLVGLKEEYRKTKVTHMGDFLITFGDTMH